MSAGAAAPTEAGTTGPGVAAWLDSLPLDPGRAPSADLAYASVPITRDDDLAAIFGKIDGADSPRVALVAPRGNDDLARQLGMRRLQRHLDLTGKDLILVTRSRTLRVRAREEGVPSVASLRRVDFEHPGGRGLHLGWVTLRLPTISALLAALLFIAAVVAGAVVLFWYVPTATVTVFVPTQTLTESIDIEVRRQATDVSVAEGVVPARRREIALEQSLIGPVTGVSYTPQDHAAVGLTFTNRTSQAQVVPKGAVLVSTAGMAFTLGADVALLPRIGGTADGIALAQRPGTVGNVPVKSVTRIDGPLADKVSVTNPNPGEKGTDLQQIVVGEQDVEGIKKYAPAYLTDVAKKELLRRFADSETVFADSAQLVINDVKPVPAIGQPAKYTEAVIKFTASMLTAQDGDLRRIWADRFRAKLAADQMLLDDGFKGTVDRAGPFDPTFDRLPVTLRVAAQVAPLVDRAELRQALAGKSRTGVERVVRDRVEMKLPPVVKLPKWAPWLPRKADRITVDVRPAP